jgi:nitrite reductase/ring-hydroxylating ferredoxin subunit
MAMDEIAHINSASLGDARCPGPSTADVIRQDGDNTPPVIFDESYQYSGNADLSYDAYTSKDYAAREIDDMWPKIWQFACREEHIPKPRDSYVHDLGPYSVLIVRQPDMSIKAFINSCRHRGMQFQANGTRSNLKIIRCPFHGWTWQTDGSLMKIPCAWDFPHADKDAFALDPVRVGRWAGFVFINLDGKAPPLTEYLEVLPDHFKHWPLENRHIKLHIEKLVPANWKLTLEAFLEAYHVMATHPQGLPTAGDANCQYDVFGDNISRFVHTVGFPSPHLTADRSQAQILKDLGGDALGITLDERDSARAVYADFLRGAFGAQMGVNLSDVSTSEMIDSIEYYCFPNLVIFPGITFRMVYRFRPNGDDIDTCIFDLYFLDVTPEGSEAPRAPDPIKISVETSFTTVEGMDPALGHIYDQDTDNLDRLTKGIKASRKAGQTLGNYQEIRIRKMRQTLDKYLGTTAEVKPD